MTYTIKIRTLPGAPFMAEYECERCAFRFELLTTRDDNGNPPSSALCPECEESAPLADSCAKIALWTRKPVAINPAGSTRKDEWDPRALDTRPLAEGKMTKPEWKKWQAGISAERRYQKRVKSGRKQKRIQVDSKGVGK